MALPHIAGTVRVAVRGLMPSGRQWANITHWQYAGGASTPGITEINNLDPILIRIWSGAVYGAGLSWLQGCIATTTITEVDYTVLDGLTLTYAISKALSGAGGANSLPSECAPVLSLRTGIRGRRYRGRIYLPAPMTTKTDASGLITAATVNAIVAQWNGAVTAAAAALWVPVVATYGVGPHGVWTPAATPITSATMDLKMDVQRRRK